MDYRDIQPGRYIGTVTSSCLGRAGNGTEQIAIGFDVHLGVDQQSVPMTWYGFFTDKAWETTEKALRALGWDPAEHDYQLDALNPQDPYDTPIKGAEAQLVLEHEDDGEGGQRIRIRWVNSVNGGLVVKERMDPGTAAEFSQTLRSRLIAQRGPQTPRRSAPTPTRPPAGPPPSRTAVAPRSPGPARPAPAPAPPPPDDVNFDDIPF
ncbi:MAG: hypothetical protein K8T90_18590 [Planctomycetes bacterium]|nr:hypothetical protein [Planctomycetota bacterium]